MNHLWQSTLFAAAAGLLTLAYRKNGAQIRYWLWFSASLKFLVPFSLLIGLGSYVPPAQRIAVPAVSVAIEQVARPFPQPALPATGGREWVAEGLAGIWICGFATIAAIRFRGWLRIRAAVRASAPSGIRAAVEVRTSPGPLEPGVVGWLRPILLVPEGISEGLTALQWEAVLAHELCHVRRRDNLTAAIHMMVEAVFWFHPLVWWIGARLVEERERACDEEVLRQGGDPHVYAEAILSVCKLYAESPLVCVAGVTGADLKKRIEAIMTNRMVRKLNLGKKAALAVAGVLALAAPVIVGLIDVPSMRAQARAQTRAPEPGYLTGLGAVTATTVTIRSRVDGELMSVSFKEGDLVQAGQVLAAIDPRPYQLQLEQAEGQLVRDQAQLMDAMQVWRTAPKDQRKAQFGSLEQLEGNLKTDQAGLDRAKLQLTYTQIASPIAGVAGLRHVDPGNIVHAADATGIVIVNQLQPIAVLFSLAEDRLSEVLARVREGASLPVEAWSRDQTARLATGLLTGFDNQVDRETGTLKFKAVFENKDGALFPNQFVNVRLYVNGK